MKAALTLFALALLFAAGGAPSNGASAATTDAVIAMNVSGTGTSCDDPTQPTVCSAPPATSFTLTVSVLDAPDAGYIGFGTDLDYQELVTSGGSYVPALIEDEIVWPEGSSGIELRSPALATGTEGEVIHGATSDVTPPFPVSTYTGIVVSLQMTCSAGISSNVLSLLPYSQPDNEVGSGFKLPDESIVPAKAGALTMDCADTSPDTDGDGCSDFKEQQTAPGSEQTGGLRDENFFWDFYDVWTHPNGDPGQGWERNREVDLFGDIFGVAGRFGAERPGGPPSKNDALTEALVEPVDETSYHAAFDRAGQIGANSWNVGAPDGTIDLFSDIFGVAFQFGHSCA